MNRGVDRQPVFFADADRVEFGRRLAELHERFGVETLAYCLMPNHYHLLIRLPHGGLAAAMRHLGSLYTRHTNDRIGRDGPLFRGRYHSIAVDSDEYLLWVARYIHRNPLALGGVDSAATYRWSSFRSYLGHRRPAPFLATQLLLDYFDGDRRRLAAFTNEPTPDERPTRGMLGSIIEFAVAQDDIVNGISESSPPQWLNRTIRLLLLDLSLDPLVRVWIEDDLQLPTGRARHMALSRARKRLANDPAVGRIFTTITQVLSHGVSQAHSVSPGRHDPTSHDVTECA